jgi:hypothetical protein
LALAVPLSRFTPQFGGGSAFFVGVAPHFMKARYVLFGSFLFVAALVARPVMWPRYDETKPPSLPLPVAYAKAMASLGQATNQYHCVRASVSNTLVRDGEWDFMFIASTPTNGIPYSWPVAVDFNGTVITNLSVIL